jgi:hypothetical protein
MRLKRCYVSVALVASCWSTAKELVDGRGAAALVVDGDVALSEPGEGAASTKLNAAPTHREVVAVGRQGPGAGTAGTGANAAPERATWASARG